jgi:hypothetical protein
MGLIGILLGLGLLIWLAYRGWSVLLLAPAAALFAAAFAREPLLAHWTQTFMGSGALQPEQTCIGAPNFLTACSETEMVQLRAKRRPAASLSANAGAGIKLPLTLTLSAPPSPAPPTLASGAAARR